MLEPIQGEAGVILAKDSFLRELRELTHQKEILLIMDEIQTGIGRTGKLWGHEHAGIKPDIMTLGKMLGGGVPLAALVANQTTSCFEHGDQGGTFNGNPLMTAVGCAVMNVVLSPGFIEKVEMLGQYMMQGISELSNRYSLGKVSGRGLLMALDLKENIALKTVERALSAGLILNAPRPNLIRFMPALNVTHDEIDKMLNILESALTKG